MSKFADCVQRGGKLRTIKPNVKQYQRVCEIDGEIYTDTVKTLKKL